MKPDLSAKDSVLTGLAGDHYVLLHDRLAGAVWGHLVGDALGVPYEFGPPVPAIEVEFRGRGAHYQPAGTWSDDGALMLALLDSLLAKGFDTTDQAQRAVAWYREDAYTPSGRFDIGKTTRAAIERFQSGAPAEEAGPVDEASCGNGSLMRILPLALVERELPIGELVDHAHRASKVTHGHHLPQVASALYVLIAREFVLGKRRHKHVLSEARARLRQLYESGAFEPNYLAALNDLEAWKERSGRGYVVDSFWSAWDAFAGASSYAEAVTRAVAYGNDTDTTAAIAGGLAGTRWGLDAIPIDWRKRMRGKRTVNRLVTLLADPVRDRYRTYVIELDEAVWSRPKMRKRNPNRRMDKPCVYVGQSVYTPRQRFKQHKAGAHTASDVSSYIRQLRPRLYKGAPVSYTRADAERVEAEWADRLRARGFGVWEGGRGPLSIARRINPKGVK